MLPPISGVTHITLAHCDAVGRGYPTHQFSVTINTVTSTGKGGQLLSRPQQSHPAATVADFRTAALNADRFGDGITIPHYENTTNFR